MRFVEYERAVNPLPTVGCCMSGELSHRTEWSKLRNGVINLGSQTAEVRVSAFRILIFHDQPFDHCRFGLLWRVSRKLGYTTWLATGPFPTFVLLHMTLGSVKLICHWVRLIATFNAVWNETHLKSFEVFYASDKCLYFCKNILMFSYAVWSYFYIFYLWYKLLQLNGHFALKMDYDVCNGFISPSLSWRLNIYCIWIMFVSFSCSGMTDTVTGLTWDCDILVLCSVLITCSSQLPHFALQLNITSE